MYKKNIKKLAKLNENLDRVQNTWLILYGTDHISDEPLEINVENVGALPGAIRTSKIVQLLGEEQEYLMSEMKALGITDFDEDSDD